MRLDYTMIRLAPKRSTTLVNGAPVVSRRQRQLDAGLAVSTVKLDIGYGPDVFETLVFRARADKSVSDFMELAGERFDSEHDAREGHAQYVARLRGGWDPR